MKPKYSPDNEQQKELGKPLTEWIADGVMPYELVDNNRHITFRIPLISCGGWRRVLL